MEGVPYSLTTGFRYTLQALLGALAAGREKEGELVTTPLEFEFHLQFPCGSPSTELSYFRQSAPNSNERECKQTKKHVKARAKSNDVITNANSLNQYFESTCSQANCNSLVEVDHYYVSGKLPTYPSPKPTLLPQVKSKC